MKRKQITASILCALLLVSCGAGETATDDTTPYETANTTAEAAPAVPIRDLGGKTFTFYVRYEEDGFDWNVSDFCSDGEDGEPVNDAVYRRNRLIEEKYNCKIAQVKSGSGQGAANLRSSITAGDGAYDGTLMSGYALVSLGLEGLLTDLTTFPELDLTQYYWNPKLCDELSLGGKLWYAMGDLSATDNRAVRCLYFNKDLFAKYGLEDPYAHVKSGNWTLDRFFRMVSEGLADLDGDGQYTNDDQWGLLVQPTIGQNIYYASGSRIVNKDSNDHLVVSIGTESALGLMQDIADKIKSEKSAINISNDYKTMIPLFAEGHGLFYSEVSLFIERFRQYEFNVGMLPMPKYDENQADYCQYADGNCLNFASIPIDSSTQDDTALLLEALSEASVDTLTKAYYDICVTGKSVRDDESVEMLDIIFRNYTIDYADLLGNNYTTPILPALSGEKEVASTIASSAKIIQKKIDEVNKFISE